MLVFHGGGLPRRGAVFGLLRLQRVTGLGSVLYTQTYRG